MSNIIEMNGKVVCVVPAGKYYLGDPQWAIRNHWDELLHPFFEAEQVGKEFNGVVEIDEAEVVAFTAVHDEATYRAWENGRSSYTTFDVETGIIALVPTSLVDDERVANRNCRLLHFEEPVVCTAYNGILTFGPMTINCSEAFSD